MMRKLSPPVLVFFLWLILATEITAAEGTIRGGSSTHTKDNTKIVGGSPVLFDRRDFDYFGFWDVGCGTSLIHEDVLLTSAHCDRPDKPDATTVYFDSTLLHQGTTRTVVDRRIHPAYTPENGIYDFMLLKLNNPMPEDEARPVSLASPLPMTQQQSQQPEYDSFTMVGFGATREGGSASPVLQQVTVQYIPHDVCAAAYLDLRVGVDNDTEFCTGGQGKDSCQGDSGGPVVDSTTGVLTGIISWGAGCARPGLYGVNARVSAGYDWIQEQLCELSDNPPASCSGNDNDTTTTPATPITGFSIPSSLLTSNNTTQDDDNQTAVLSLIVEIEYDAYPTEISWTLVSDETNETIVPLEYGQMTDAGQVVSKTIPDLPEGSYTFQIQDSYGDGLCGDQGCGSFSIRNEQSLLFQNDGHFFNTLSLNIHVQQSSASR